MKKKFFLMKQHHPYHMVINSPWPILASLSGMGLLGSLFMWFHVKNNILVLIFALMMIIFQMVKWLWDVIMESTYLGYHTLAVQKNLRMGFSLFLVTEMMFFFSLFWAFFHFSLAPSTTMGTIWPPMGMMPPKAFGIPQFETIMLMSSGFWLTWTHHAIQEKKSIEVTFSLFFVLLCGFFFSYFQLWEWKHKSFTMSEGVYGSTFYVLTGFHGIHVIAGTVFLLVKWCRHMMNHFSSVHHMGFLFAIWYWHFVDVVWIFVWLFVYIWGGWMPVLN